MSSRFHLCALSISNRLRDRAGGVAVVIASMIRLLDAALRLLEQFVRQHADRDVVNDHERLHHRILEPEPDAPGLSDARQHRSALSIAELEQVTAKARDLALL